MKVAIVHYWLVRMRGGEKVLEQLCELFPEADIFTHVFDPEKVSPRILSHRIQTTFINRLPFAKHRYPTYLPLMPMALEELDLTDYDLVISSESGPAKGVVVRQDAIHICYCHTPMRYVWNMYHTYRKNAGRTQRVMMTAVSHYLRMWDRVSADRVDFFVSNSQNTAQRVRRYYNRSSTVVYPPVETEAFSASATHDGYYLSVGQLIPYKRIDIAIEAFNRTGLPLHIVGDGSEMQRLRKMAQSNIRFLGWLSPAELQREYSRCKALIFPGEEDFGIVPIEAMASGKPVIAYARGGALETVIPGKTGMLFDVQTAAALQTVVEEFIASESAFDFREIVRFAAGFSTARFKSRMADAIRQAIADSPPRGWHATRAAEKPAAPIRVQKSDKTLVVSLPEHNAQPVSRL